MELTARCWCSPALPVGSADPGAGFRGHVPDCRPRAADPDQPPQWARSGDLETLEHEVEAELEWSFEVAVAAHVHGDGQQVLGHAGRKQLTDPPQSRQLAVRGRRRARPAQLGERLAEGVGHHGSHDLDRPAPCEAGLLQRVELSLEYPQGAHRHDGPRPTLASPPPRFHGPRAEAEGARTARWSRAAAKHHWTPQASCSMSRAASCRVGRRSVSARTSPAIRAWAGL